MLRFLIDIFRFPFAPNSKKNKFWRVLKFVYKEYLAYFWSNPNLFKILLFPFLLIYIICKKENYQKLWCLGQNVILIILIILIYIFLWINKYWSLSNYATRVCLKNSITLEVCYKVWNLLNYKFIWDKTYYYKKYGKLPDNLQK